MYQDILTHNMGNKVICLTLFWFWFQETLLQHPFSEILSTRRYRSDYNVNYLDMKIGDLMVQSILRIETDQVKNLWNC